MAQRVEHRVANFARWLEEFPDARMELCGKKIGPDVWDMAPPFVQQEYSDWSVLQIMCDQSKGCLSRIGKIEKFTRREF